MADEKNQVEETEVPAPDQVELVGEAEKAEAEKFCTNDTCQL